jgi:hypothetical protein
MSVTVQVDHPRDAVSRSEGILDMIQPEDLNLGGPLMNFKTQ